MDKTEFESEELTASEPNIAENTGRYKNVSSFDNESFEEDAMPNKSDGSTNESRDSSSDHQTENIESPNDEVFQNADEHEISQTDAAGSVDDNVDGEEPDGKASVGSDNEKMKSESPLQKDSTANIDEDEATEMTTMSPDSIDANQTETASSEDGIKSTAASAEAKATMKAPDLEGTSEIDHETEEGENDQTETLNAPAEDINEETTADQAEADSESAAPANDPSDVVESDTDSTMEQTEPTLPPEDAAPSTAATDVDEHADSDDGSLVFENSESDEQQETPGDTSGNEKPPQAAAAKSSPLKVAMAVLLLGAIFSGFFLFDNKSKIGSSNTEKTQKSKIQKPQSKLKRTTIIELKPEVRLGIYGSHINEVSALREILLKKQAEVVALKERYQQSIDELEKEILDEQRAADIKTFLQASGNQHIVFGLKTIQRRQAYIAQLGKPLGWVNGACEDLLYLKRCIMTDLHISEVASGIEMDKHVQNIREAINKYQPTADTLAIDSTQVRLESLEKIWARIQSKQHLATSEPAYSRNQIIAEQICTGDFSRMGDLSEISTATATCITEMNGSDLFLNHLTEISPGAARQLCRWKGSWICMNGIRALSPRVAHYLFQWNGEWISLNGLTEFPAEVGEMLLKWDGEQLELMGLPDTPEAHDRIGIEYLTEWERSGGKVFVPPKLRKKINALHRHSG